MWLFYFFGTKKRLRYYLGKAFCPLSSILIWMSSYCMFNSNLHLHRQVPLMPVCRFGSVTCANITRWHSAIALMPPYFHNHKELYLSFPHLGLPKNLIFLSGEDVSILIETRKYSKNFLHRGTMRNKKSQVDESFLRFIPNILVRCPHYIFNFYCN